MYIHLYMFECNGEDLGTYHTSNGANFLESIKFSQLSREKNPMCNVCVWASATFENTTLLFALHT